MYKYWSGDFTNERTGEAVLDLLVKRDILFRRSRVHIISISASVVRTQPLEIRLRHCLKLHA